MTEMLDIRGLSVAIAGKLAADFVHDDFGVVFAGQVMIGLAEELVLELLEIRELARKLKGN